MNGNFIKGLPITNNPDAGMDEALSRGQAIALVADKIAISVEPAGIRDYVSGMRVSPGGLVRNTTSGITYRFEGTTGAITAAPALSANWRPTTGPAICVLREGDGGASAIVSGGGAFSGTYATHGGAFSGAYVMHHQLTVVAINTDSAYTTSLGLITIPRTGVYRLSGYAKFLIGNDSPSVKTIRVAYVKDEIQNNELFEYTVGGQTADIIVSLVLPTVAIFFNVNDKLGMKVYSAISGNTPTAGRLLLRAGAGLQVEFLY
jgi:hypothetical protein